jgi:hypothetical protein
MKPAESMDHLASAAPEAVLQTCSRCAGLLRFEVRLDPLSAQSYGHRIYRCEACGRHEWVAEPPGQRT